VDEPDFAKYYELGRENARIIDLAAQHCRHMRFAESGGRGMVEEWTGLPLNARRVECPVAIGNMVGMRLDYVALEFYRAHCLGCEHRQPTGRLPNLETEYQARQEQARVAEAARAERRRQLDMARAERVERRRGLRVAADPAATALLDDLDIVDKPQSDGNAETERGARRRLAAVASRAGDRFSGEIVEELFDVVVTVGVTELLEPLRHLTAHRPEFGPQLVRTALGVLTQRPDPDAGRCLTDHSALLQPDDVNDSVIRSLIALAGSKTPENHHFSGPSPVVTANDPGPLRIAVGLAPGSVTATVCAMLPRPEAKGLVVAPAHLHPRVSDFDRRAAAGAVERLVDSHLDVAIDLLPDLALSLAVPPDDSYDPGTLGAAERALGRMLVRSPAKVVVFFENAGKHASEETRSGLVRAVRHAVGMVDADNPHRRAEDPVVNAQQAKAVHDVAFGFLLARTDESWGHAVTFEAAETIESMGRRQTGSLKGRIDAMLGAFLALTRRRLNHAQASLIAAAPNDELAALEAFSRRNSLYQAGSRLLRAVESAASHDPVAACRTVCTVIGNERDSDFGADAVMPLLGTLGEIGRSHGSEPGVLQALLPTLHTYLVDADPGPRSAALEAWTAIGSRHSLPSTVNDLLPALVSDPYVVVMNAVLEAACRLEWAGKESRARLALHALSVMEVVDVREHLETFLSALSALRHHVPDLMCWRGCRSGRSPVSLN
jgi:hypothetical protein